MSVISICLLIIAVINLLRSGIYFLGTELLYFLNISIPAAVNPIVAVAPIAPVARVCLAASNSHVGGSVFSCYCKNSTLASVVVFTTATATSVAIFAN